MTEENTSRSVEIQALLEMQALSGKESPPQTSTAAAGGVEEREPKKVKWSLGSFIKKTSTHPGPAALSDRGAIEGEKNRK